MNKKGFSMSGWTEGILFSVLIVMILIGVIGGMNLKYGKDNQIGLGGNTTESAFITYQDTLEREIRGGEAEFSTSQGLTWKSSWTVIKSGVNIIWDFLTGSWIETICSYMHLPTAVPLIFRIIYFLSIGFIILTILMKVKP